MSPDLGRREFLGSTVVVATATALGGVGLLSGCSHPSSDTSGSGSTGTGGTPGFQLSTRHQRKACKACQAHAHNRVYISRDAAAADRAHPGCNCEIAERSLDAATHSQYFGGGATVHDKRA